MVQKLAVKVREQFQSFEKEIEDDEGVEEKFKQEKVKKAKHNGHVDAKDAENRYKKKMDFRCEGSQVSLLM